jgi:hypothetical protein
MAKQIDIPFNKWSRERLKAKRKSSTARSKVYGEINDWFIVDDIEYVITMIFENKATTDIISRWFTMEGADSPEEIEKIIKGIFRGRLPETLNLHIFKERNPKV